MADGGGHAPGNADSCETKGFTETLIRIVMKTKDEYKQVVVVCE